jgi:hypothetical protein
MNMLASAKARYDQVRDLADFAKFCAILATSGDPREAERKAEAAGLSEKTQRVVAKAVAAAGTTAGIPDVAAVIRPFMQQLRSASAFDRLLPDTLRVPLGTRVSILSTVLTASTVAEGSAKPLQNFTLTPTEIEPVKVVALIALSKELIDVLGDDGLRNLSRELVEAVSVGSDAALMSVLASVNAFEGNSTASFDVMLSGIEELLRNVELSKLVSALHHRSVSNSKRPRHRGDRRWRGFDGNCRRRACWNSSACHFRTIGHDDNDR